MCVCVDGEEGTEREMKVWPPKCYSVLSQGHEFQIIFTLYNQGKNKLNYQKMFQNYKIQT